MRGIIYRYLNEKGFLIGKIYPRCVIFSDYHPRMENFYGSNYIAVRSEQKELIEALQKYGG